jgi:hypothetical protein
MILSSTAGALAFLFVAAAGAQTSAPDPGEVKHAQRLEVQAKTIDADAAQATATPEGQRRVTESLAKQFKVPESTITDLRSRKLGYGEIGIALALSQELMKQNTSLTQQQALDTILARRQTGGQGWGAIANSLGLKLGRVVSEVHAAERRIERIAKVERAAHDERYDKGEKADRTDKTDKPDRTERVERPERVERVDKSGRH